MSKTQEALEAEALAEAWRFNWGSKTPAEIVHEFACVRGDLSEQSGRDALAKVIEWKIARAKEDQ